MKQQAEPGGVTSSREYRRSRRAARMAEAREQARPAQWQARKSALTREDTLDAAVRCLLRDGYANLTTTRIAQEAGISRGAAAHHFPAKADLFRALVERLTHLRMTDFRKRISGIADSADRNRAGLEAYWSHLTQGVFAAYLELVVAARTDPDLSALVDDMVRQFEREWTREVLEMFPEWRGHERFFGFAMDITQFLFEGMAVHAGANADNARYLRLRQWLSDFLQSGLRADGSRHRQD